MIVWWEEQNSLLYLFVNVEIVSRGGGNWFTVGRIQCGAGVGEVYSCFHAAANSRSRSCQAHATSPAHYVSWYSWLDVVGRNFYHTQQLPLWAVSFSSSSSSCLSQNLVPRSSCVHQWHMRAWQLRRIAFERSGVIIVAVIIIVVIIIIIIKTTGPVDKIIGLIIMKQDCMWIT